MINDKVKQYIALFGGFLSATYMLLLAYGFNADWINPKRVGAITAFLAIAVPFGINIYGIFKNTYILTRKARRNERIIKRSKKIYRNEEM